MNASPPCHALPNRTNPSHTHPSTPSHTTPPPLLLQIEEPFSILPLEAFCNGAIAATMEEMVNNYRAESYDGAKALETPSAKDEVGVVAKAKPQYSKRW